MGEQLAPAGRDDAPHAAVLFVRYEVHERLGNGNLRGTPVEAGQKVFKLEGADRQTCLRRLRELFKELGRE